LKANKVSMMMSLMFRINRIYPEHVTFSRN
jgi:hypothetical protein